MNGIRQEIAIEILKLSPRDKDALADVIGLGMYALIGVGLLVLIGYRGYQFLRFIGVL